MKYNKFFIIMLFMVLLGGITTLICPVLISIWSGDKIGFDYNRVLMIFVILLASYFLQMIFTVFREKFAKDFNIKNCNSILRKYLKLNYDEINDKGPTNLIDRVFQAVNSIYTYMTGSFISIWSGIIVMLIILVLVFLQNKIIALVMFLLIPFNYYAYKILNKILMKKSKRLQENTALAFQNILSVLSQTDYLKQCSCHESTLKLIKPYITKLYKSMSDVNIFAQCTSSGISAVCNIVRTMILVLAVYNFINSNTSPLCLVLYTIILPIYFNNMAKVTNSNLDRSNMKVSMDFLDQWDSLLESDGDITIQDIDNIKFDIDTISINDKEIQINLHDKFEKGDIVWVKGKSGCGKSTLMKNLVKFRLCNSVYINNNDIKHINNASLRSKIEYLSQDVPIIKGTLRDNLFFNKNYSSTLEKKLCSEEILVTLMDNNGIGMDINEKGSNLSGGEKQRIAITRALYEEVDVLILDEVTSNIDKKSAVEILDRVMKDSDNKIIFIISHDDLPEKYANKVICM